MAIDRLYSQFYILSCNSLLTIIVLKQIFSFSLRDSLGENESKRHHNMISEIAVH